MTTSQGETDYLWRNISELPYFRGLLRAVEARTYRDIPLPGPVLDLGVWRRPLCVRSIQRKTRCGA